MEGSGDYSNTLTLFVAIVSSGHRHVIEESQSTTAVRTASEVRTSGGKGPNGNPTAAQWHAPRDTIWDLCRVQHLTHKELTQRMSGILGGRIRYAISVLLCYHEKRKERVKLRGVLFVW
jgi:hypothetical protein